jgi:hypothetical protein
MTFSINTRLRPRPYAFDLAHGEERFGRAKVISQAPQDDPAASDEIEGEMSNKNVHIRKIVLEEARAKGATAGPGVHGYEFVAPLDDAGFINIGAWKNERVRCFVHRLEHGQVVERGLLAHRAGGIGGATWAFDYEPGTTDEEEEGYRFGSHAFKPGEYVSIRDYGGELRTFKVTAVMPT